jgi:anaphase-promoting complex subunit 3
VNLHLLATCYYRGGNPNRAIAVLEGARAPENRYLLAICCFQKNKLVEAENALVGGENGYVGAASTNESIPNGAAGMYLMGRICRRVNRRQQAIECFVRAYVHLVSLFDALV